MRHLKLDGRQIPAGGGEPVGARRFELAALEFDDGFDALPSPARFAATAAGRRIEVEFLRGYPCAQVFAPLDGPFICFEPMVAPANALGSGIGLQLLDPGKRFRASFSVSVQQLRAGR
jgi:galactose mutarotase-like enzyme